MKKILNNKEELEINDKDRFYIMVKEKVKLTREIKAKPIENSDIVFYNHFKNKRLTAERYRERVKQLKIRDEKFMEMKKNGISQTQEEENKHNTPLDFIYDLKNKEVWKKIKKYKFF